jgi:hypothetical protein
MYSRALALLVGFALAAGACNKATPQLHLVGVCGFPDAAATCTSPIGTCGTYLNGRPWVATEWDGHGNDLALLAEVYNEAADSTDHSAGRVNTHDAIIDSAKISYTVTGSPTLKLADVETSGLYSPVLASAHSTIYMYPIGPGTLQAIAAGTAAGAEVEVVAHLKLAGKYTDGSSLETQTFDIPILVRNEDCKTPICPDGSVQPACPKACQTATFDSCGSTGTTTTYTIGGLISGLTATGLVLSNPGTADLTVPANATSFVFATGVAGGTAYAVTVRTQPTGQTCTVTAGTGTVSGANVTSVQVTCN